MKRFLLGAVVAVLCSVPAVSRAETPGEARNAAAPVAPYFLARPAPDTQAAGTDEAREYAAREKASPQLAQFSGGADGVYITSGAIAVALAIVLILVLI